MSITASEISAGSTDYAAPAVIARVEEVTRGPRVPGRASCR